MACISLPFARTRKRKESKAHAKENIMPFRKRGGECLSFGGIRTKPSLSSCYRSTLRIVHVSMSSEYVRASDRHFPNPGLRGSSRDFPIQDFWISRFSIAVHNLYGILFKIYYNFVILELRPAYHPGFFGSFDFPPPSTTSMVSY